MALPLPKVRDGHHRRPKLAANQDATRSLDARQFADTILQSTSNALDGPHGVDPSNLIAALGSLAGYAARWRVWSKIRDGSLENDFVRPANTNMPHVTVSDHVTDLVADMTGESYASIVISELMAAGSHWLPNVPQMMMHNFVGINSPRYPDFTIEERYWPELPPQYLLSMMWETHRGMLASTGGALEVAIRSYAHATAAAAKCNRHSFPMAVAGQLALEICHRDVKNRLRILVLDLCLCLSEETGLERMRMVPSV